MSFEIRYTPVFQKALKPLAKKYLSMHADYGGSLDDLGR